MKVLTLLPPIRRYILKYRSGSKAEHPFRQVQPLQAADGHSLPELLMVLAIITTLSALTLPLLSPAPAQEAEQVFERFARVLGNTRAQAITRQQVLIICPNSNAHHCGRDWSAGLLVFVDADGDGVLSGTEAVLDRLSWLPSADGGTQALSGSLHWRAFGNRQRLRISELGELADQNGSLSWCPPPDSMASAHQLVINASGRIRLAVDSNGDGLREDSQGNPVRC